jgi:pyruvate formate lyase activating enzyme
MKEAYLYDSGSDKSVRCRLCYKQCHIRDGYAGFCGVRRNVDGILIAENYGVSTYFVRDTIETEGVFHYRPGCATIEIGTYGCNLHCKFCQNWKYSQANLADPESFVRYTPEEVVDKCIEMGVDLIAWTFNDPIIWYEFVIDTARLAKQRGITSLYKSSHIISLEALENLCESVDVFSVSLKSIRGEFYREHCEGSIEPVMAALKYLNGRADKHLEVSNLMIPEINDSSEEISELVEWLKANLDETVPLHFVRYHPDYQFTIPRTPVETVMKARSIALDMGMKHVYVGNVFSSDGLNTTCPECGVTLIRREGQRVDFLDDLDRQGCQCRACGVSLNRLVI